MTDPRKQFDTRKSVSMTAAFAKAIEREAKRRRKAERRDASEGEVMRDWMEAGQRMQKIQDGPRRNPKMRPYIEPWFRS